MGLSKMSSEELIKYTTNIDTNMSIIAVMVQQDGFHEIVRRLVAAGAQLSLARESLQEIVRLDDKCEPGLEYDTLCMCGETARAVLDKLDQLGGGSGMSDMHFKVAKYVSDSAAEITRLRAELAEAQAQLAIAREGLGFYAKPDTWYEYWTSEDRCGLSCITSVAEQDEGIVACDTLAKMDAVLIKLKEAGAPLPSSKDHPVAKREKS